MKYTLFHILLQHQMNLDKFMEDKTVTSYDSQTPSLELDFQVDKHIIWKTIIYRYRYLYLITVETN